MSLNRMLCGVGRAAAVGALFMCAGPAWAQPARPQTPEGPFPYEVEEVVIGASDAGLDDAFWIMPRGAFTHELGATITLPDPEVFGPGPYAGVVLISGSGAQDRDSTIMAHKPFAVIADTLTRAGIAVLRFDDRGAGSSTGSYNDTTIEAHAHDAWVAARYLMEHPKVHASRVGLLGHSQGGTLAPYILAHDPDIAFLVLMAGTGVPGGEVLIDQTELIYERINHPQDYIDECMVRRSALFEALCAGEDDEALLEKMTELAAIEFKYASKGDARGLAEGMLPQFTSPAMASFICFDPRPYLAQVDVPVLAMGGTVDTQVTPRLNLDSIREILEESKNKEATVVELVGVNHLFQRAEIGVLGEYGRIKETMDLRVLDLLEAWVVGTADRLE